MAGPSRDALGDVGILALLLIRGLLLWVLIPVGLLLWILVFSWSARVSLGTFLRWLDLNLMAALQRMLVLPVSGQSSMRRIEFVSARQIQSVSHRVNLVYDPL